MRDRINSASNHATQAMLVRFAPYLFMDEDEDCGIATGWRPQVRFQVRPIAHEATYTVSDWQPDDGELKAVQITYYMNWPLDCGPGDHLGDSERLSYLVGTIDMNEFVLVSATHNYHSDSSMRSGFTAFVNAKATDFDRSIIAVGQNKHASWWGKSVRSDHCAASEDHFWDDCFGKSWAFDAESYLHVSGGGLVPEGYHENVHPLVLHANHNIGEPPRSSPQFDSTGRPAGQRFLESETGGFLHSELVNPNDPSEGRRYFEPAPYPLDGSQEYWHEAPANYGRFCGFLCRASDQRGSDGNCERQNLVVHPGKTESFGSCASPLSEKLDTTLSEFGYPPPSTGGSGLTAESCLGRSCTSRNFSNTARCQCDEACHFFGDCCTDKVSVCGDFDPASCEGKCGRRWTDRSQTCSCSYNCVARGDCCSDAASLCAQEISTPYAHSCENRCGSTKDDYFTCACDHLCAARGDCCIDKLSTCPIHETTVLGSCAASCGPTPGTAYGGLCFCDSECVERGDCCLDAGQLCDVEVDGSPFPMMFSAPVDRVFCAQRPAACRAMQQMYEVEVSQP